MGNLCCCNHCRRTDESRIGYTQALQASESRTRTITHNKSTNLSVNNLSSVNNITISINELQHSEEQSHLNKAHPTPPDHPTPPATDKTLKVYQKRNPGLTIQTTPFTPTTSTHKANGESLEHISPYAFSSHPSPDALKSGNLGIESIEIKINQSISISETEQKLEKIYDETLQENTDIDTDNDSKTDDSMPKPANISIPKQEELLTKTPSQYKTEKRNALQAAYPSTTALLYDGAVESPKTWRPYKYCLSFVPRNDKSLTEFKISPYDKPQSTRATSTFFSTPVFTVYEGEDIGVPIEMPLDCNWDQDAWRVQQFYWGSWRYKKIWGCKGYFRILDYKEDNLNNDTEEKDNSLSANSQLNKPDIKTTENKISTEHLKIFLYFVHHPTIREYLGYGPKQRWTKKHTIYIDSQQYTLQFFNGYVFFYVYCVFFTVFNIICTFQKGSGSGSSIIYFEAYRSKCI